MAPRKPEHRPPQPGNMKPPGLVQSHVALVLCGILAVSLAIRMAHLAAILKNHDYLLPTIFEQTDMRAFLDWSDSIMAGDVLQRSTFHPYFSWMRPIAPLDTWCRWWGGKAIFQQEPLYVYALSLIRWASGRSLWVPLLIQLIIGSFQPLVVYLLARRLADQRAGLVAAALAAIYGPFIFYQGMIMRDWLPPLMEPIALVLILRLDRRGRSVDGLLAGAWLALCALTKSLILLFLPFALAWLAYRRRADRRRWWLRPMLVLAGFAVGLSPLIIRNAIVGAPILAFHNRTAEGFIQANAVDAQPIGLSYPPSMKAIFEKTDGHLPAVVIETLRPYKGHWLDFLRLQILKLRGNLDPIDIPNNMGFYHAREHSPALWVTLGFGPVAAVGLAGLLLAIRRRGPHGLALIYVVTQVVALMSATVLGRYRLALAAVLLVYAGIVVVELWDAVRRQQARPAAIRVGLLLAGFVVLSVLIPLPNLRTEPGYELYYPDYRSSATLAISEQRFGDALTESQRLGGWAGRFPEAADVSRGLERDIQHVWARALLEQGDKRGALEHARAAARIQIMERQLDHVHYQLGELFYQLGDPADALAQLRLYLRKQPNGPLAAQARDLLSKIEQPSPTTVSEPKN